MNDTQLETIEQIKAFLSGSQTVELIIKDKMDPTHRGSIALPTAQQSEKGAF